MKGIRRTRCILLVMLLFAGIAALAFGLLYHRSPYSSPTAPRNVSAHEDLFKTGSFIQSFPEDPFANLKITTNGSDLEVEFAYQTRENPPTYPVTIFQNIGSEPAFLGEGSISLVYTGLAYGQPIPPNKDHVAVPWKFFTMEGAPAPLSVISNLYPVRGTPPKTEFYGIYPEAQFIWERKNVQDVKLLGVQLFDARTKWSLVQGYGMSMLEGGFWVSGTLQSWRPHPIELALTLGTGPVRNHDLGITPGSEVRFASGIVRFLGSFPGESRSWSTMQRDTNTLISVRLQDDLTGRIEHLTTFFFLVWPGSATLPMEIRLLDDKGQKVATSGGHTGATLQSLTIAADAEEVRDIQVRHYSRVFRVITTLPFIPGMPEQNENVENLFHTVVPYAHFRAEWDLRAAVENLAQMRMMQMSLTYPNGYFPISFTNATTADFYREMQRWIPEGRELSADPEKNEIALRDPPLTRLWNRIKEIAARD